MYYHNGKWKFSGITMSFVQRFSEAGARGSISGVGR